MSPKHSCAKGSLIKLIELKIQIPSNKVPGWLRTANYGHSMSHSSLQSHQIHIQFGSIAPGQWIPLANTFSLICVTGQIREDEQAVGSSQHCPWMVTPS